MNHRHCANLAGTFSRRRLLQASALVAGGLAVAGAPLAKAAPARQAGGPVKLRLQNWFADTDMQDWQIGLDMVKALHPNIEIALEFAPYDDTVARTLAAATAGDLPDLIMCSTDHTPSLVTSGVLADLNDRIKQAGDIKPDEFAPGVAQGFHMWDRWWGFPYDVSTFGIYYNKDMFDAAGVAYPPARGETPWTWDQFVEAAQKVTKPNGEQWGVWWPTDSGVTAQYLASNFIYSAGGRNFDDALRKCIIHSDEAAAGIQFMVDLIHKHQVAPPPAETAGGDINYLQSGLCAMMLDGQWSLGQTTRGVDFPFDISYFPLDKEKRLVTGGSGFAMSATTKHPDEAWQWLTAFTSQKTLAAMIGATGRGIPARRSATQSYIDSAATKNAAIFVEQLDYT
ncbi:MAG TPA: sugar ABC transporter substrate-binding protein, partial [Thermomicrobiales bacterium]|nr:sugar ABC transporter substrate-binding protein [Thermomicrobiales bacterium]